MRITIESTLREVEVHRAKGRVWQGTTDNGVRVVVIVTRMAVACDATDEMLVDGGIHGAPMGPLTSVEPSADALEAFPDAVPFTGWPLKGGSDPASSKD